MSEAESAATSAAELRSSVDPAARYQARIALVTAIVALVSALLGPLVSLLINKSQVENQREQSERSSTQADSEFVRSQRSEAYSAYMAAFNNAMIDLLGASGAFAAGGDVEELTEQAEKSVEAVKAVTTAYYQVKVVGSGDAVEAADALYSEFGTWSGALLTIGGTVVQGEADTLTQEQVDLLQTTDDQYVELLGLANDFIAEGRPDMKSDLDADD